MRRGPTLGTIPWTFTIPGASPSVTFRTTTRHLLVFLTGFTGSTGWEGILRKGARARSSKFTVRCSMFDVHSRKGTVKGEGHASSGGAHLRREVLTPQPRELG